MMGSVVETLESKPVPVVMLATGCIAPRNTPLVELRDPRERLLQYVTSLTLWLQHSTVTDLVFCENSGSCFDFAPLEHLAAELGKRFEVLVFTGNERAQRRGKGAGEAEIVDYALQHSKLLAADRSFYKITGRLFVRNFDAIEQAHREDRNVFAADEDWTVMTFRRLPRCPLASLRHCYFALRALGAPYPSRGTPTIFYKVHPETYRGHLRVGDDVYDGLGIYLEHLYYVRLRQVDWVQLAIRPELIGNSATHGGRYDADYPEEALRLAQELCRQPRG